LTRDTRNPFTLFRGEVDWRPNPLVDEGRMHIATGTFVVDTRNDEDNPWSGWHISADWERGVGTLSRLDALTTPNGTELTFTTPIPTTYSRGFLDIRRYNRVSPEAQLNLRALIGGWLSGDPLPLERRVSVDGPGVMPGYGFRNEGSGVDYGTCNVGTSFPGQPALCDRIALLQAEYRGDLHFDFHPDWESHDDVGMRAREDVAPRARAARRIADLRERTHTVIEHIPKRPRRRARLRWCGILHGEGDVFVERAAAILRSLAAQVLKFCRYCRLDRSSFLALV
jgi:hypothetical protein